MKSSRPPLIVLSIVVIIPSTIIAILYANSTLRENNLRSTLHSSSNSHMLFEDQARYGADIAQKSLYYWTADAIEVVQEYYEKMFPAFKAGNAEKEWLITGFNSDGSPSNTFSNSSFLAHSSFCDYRQPYDCITLVLAKTNQPNLYVLPIMSPSSFKILTPPPNYLTIPPEGTLIIYSYYVLAG
jgi:hypothetical protein